MTSRPTVVFYSLLTSVLLPAAAAAAAPNDLTCPKGTRQEGAPPPAGAVAWCAGPDLFGQLRRNGPFKRWRPNGQVLREGEYVDGKKHGQWVEYDEAGQASAEAVYRFGQLISSSGVVASQSPTPKVEAPPSPPTPATAKVSSPSPQAPAPTAPTAPAPASEEWVSHRPDDDLELEARPRSGKSPVGARLRFDNTMSSMQVAFVYAPQLDLQINLGAFLLEAQWGLSVISVPGLEAITAPLNPMLLVGGELKYDALTISLGVGATVPVLSIEANQEGLLKLSAAVAAPTVRGMRDFWLSLPEVPAVILPIRGRYQKDALEVRFRAVPYFAIPIHGGSSDLALELGAGATYGIDVFRFGGDLHLVSVGVTSGNFFLSVEPKVGVAFGPAEIYASLSLTPLKPELADFAGLLWATNLGVQLAFD